MAAPRGNQYWKLRSKHGRDKLFATSELLWEAATEYFKWCDNHPWIKHEQVKSPAKPYYDNEKERWVTSDILVKVPTARPYTMQGLCLYLNCNTAYFRQFKSELPKDEQDFSTVIHTIEDIVYLQKFEGATVGVFNPNIIARDLGLADKKELGNIDGQSFDVTLNLK